VKVEDLFILERIRKINAEADDKINIKLLQIFQSGEK
jgi:hypothetical protein